MSKRYIVALDSGTEEQNDEFLAFLKEKEVGWWHWVSNFWLVTDPEEKCTTDEIRDKLMECYPTVTGLVIELNERGETWSGYGPKTEARNMFTWLRSTWDSYERMQRPDG